MKLYKHTYLHDYLYPEQYKGGMGEKAEWFFYGVIFTVAVVAVRIVWLMFVTS